MKTKGFIFDKILRLLRDEIPTSSGIELMEQCRKLNMLYQSGVENSQQDSPIPFDKSYSLVFATPNDNRGTMTIFESQNKITEVEIQIFQPWRGAFKKALKSFNSYYGTYHQVYPWKKEVAIHFEDNISLGYLSKIKVNSYNIITLRFGNKEIWDYYFPRIKR